MSKTGNKIMTKSEKNHNTYKEKRYEFLKKYKPDLYHCLIQENKLLKHLALIQQSAENREKQIIESLIKKEPLERHNAKQELIELHFEGLREQARQIVEIEIIRV